jgi:hypothetical protein
MPMRVCLFIPGWGAETGTYPGAFASPLAPYEPPHLGSTSTLSGYCWRLVLGNIRVVLYQQADKDGVATRPSLPPRWL